MDKDRLHLLTRGLMAFSFGVALRGDMRTTRDSGVNEREVAQGKAVIFTPENSVGYDFKLHQFFVLDSNRCPIGPFGDGEFENGVRVNILYHLRGGKVKDVPKAWVAKDENGNFMVSGILKIASYSDSAVCNK